MTESQSEREAALDLKESWNMSWTLESQSEREAGLDLKSWTWESQSESEAALDLKSWEAGTYHGSEKIRVNEKQA